MSLATELGLDVEGVGDNAHPTPARHDHINFCGAAFGTQRVERVGGDDKFRENLRCSRQPITRGCHRATRQHEETLHDSTGSSQRRVPGRGLVRAAGARVAR